jgi:hypothetical protein
MRRYFKLIGLIAVAAATGCNSDIVSTKLLKDIKYKCVYIAPLNSEDPHVGQVLRDTLEKELINSN